MAVSPFDSFLASLDGHIENAKAPEAPVAGPSFFARRKAVAEVEQADDSTRLALSPLERALYHEVETRRRQLRRKQKELDFWQAYEQGELQYKVPTSSTALASQIKEKRRRLEELQGEDNLKIETSKALDAAASIQKTLSTTSTSLDKKSVSEEKQYATTRQLLDDRDDKALEFLRVYNEIRAIRAQRQQTKAKIRDERQETAQLLRNIKSLKADIAARQLSPAGVDPDASTQDATIAQQVKRLHSKIAEARSKLELVKGIIRGLILESGKDWTKNRETRDLMLSLDDDDDASDDAFSDDEAEGTNDMDVDDDQDNDDLEDDS